MGFTAKTTNSSSSANKSMGLLLVFFPEGHNATKNNSVNVNRNNYTHTLSSAQSSSSSSSSSSCFSPNSITKLINKTTNSNSSSTSSLLLTKAQSTISICAFFVFLTLLVFTLSTFEPTIPIPTTTKAPPRFLSNTNNFNTVPFSNSSNFFIKLWNPKIHEPQNKLMPSFALQGMGTLYMRGTKAMNDLLVTHVVEDVTENELHLFLRLLHKSGITSKADTLLVFASSVLVFRFESVIQEENDSFFKLVHAYNQELSLTSRDPILSRFDVTQFAKHGKKEMKEPLWGKRKRGNYSDINLVEEDESELTHLCYGSVLGFEANELNPENSLSGFLDHVPMSLRRWACYLMLLGRVRCNFKHILLADMKNSLLLSDPLVRVRNRSPELVYVWFKQDSSSSNKHSRKNSDKTQSSFLVNLVILMGGARGIRRLSNEILTEIVRTAMQHKKNSISESVIFAQLVGTGYIAKNLYLIKSSESIPDTSSLAGLSSNSASVSSLMDYAIIPSGNGNHDLINSIIMKQICSCEVDSFVYRDC